MKTFFKDYMELCKASGDFYKKHTLGTVVFSIAAGIVGFLVSGGGQLIADKISEKRYLKQLKKGINSKEES